MTMMPATDKTPSPWYRHRWPWILMAGPFAVVLAGGVTAYLAVSSNDGLVEDDYYKQGLAVNQIAARDHRAGELGMVADLSLGPGGALVSAKLSARSGAAGGTAFPPRLFLRLVHPTRPGGDQRVALQADEPGRYVGKLTMPLAGRWHVALEDEAKEWRLTGEWNVDRATSVTLSAGAGQ